MLRSKYGWALYLSGRFDEAQKVWISILRDEPIHGPALTYLGQLAFKKQQYQLAYDYYRKSLSVPEDSPFAISNNEQIRASTLHRFALAANKIKKTGEAINALKLAVDYTPSDATIQFELGNTYIGLQQFEQALPHVEIANALQSNTPRILAALGYIWFKLDDNQKAIGFLEQAVKLAPTFALAWYHLGNAQVEQGDVSAAKESFVAAVQLQPTFKPAKDALMMLEGR
jgi:tetratricopeptide (TPR) repeat protein